MIIAALATAFIVRFYVHLAARVHRFNLRDVTDMKLHILCGVCCVAGMTLFHIDVRNALAAAFVADALVHLRELLDLIKEMCKNRLPSPLRRR